MSKPITQANLPEGWLSKAIASPETDSIARVTTDAYNPFLQVERRGKTVMTPEQIKPFVAECRGREQKATPGPWCVEVGKKTDELFVNQQSRHRSTPGGRIVRLWNGFKHRDGNADFIAHARADLPRALDIIEQQGEALKKKVAQLTECFRLSGADPDDNEDWRLAKYAVQEVKRMREESDQSEAANAALQHEIAELKANLKRCTLSLKTAESENARLREILQLTSQEVENVRQCLFDNCTRLASSLSL